MFEECLVESGGNGVRMLFCRSSSSVSKTLKSNSMNVESRSPMNCQILYTAFRGAFVVTLDSLLRYSLDRDSFSSNGQGFMSCFPLLNGVAPQIQIECLFRTWNRIRQGETSELEALDDLVIYGACESLAKITLEKKGYSLRAVHNGPRNLPTRSDIWLYSQTRCLQVAGSGAPDPHFLRRLSPIQKPVTEADAEFTTNWCEKREEILELVGRWVAHRQLLLGSEGLLTLDEQDMLRAFFEEHPGLVR